MNGLYRTSVECPDSKVRVSTKQVIPVVNELIWCLPLLTVIISEQKSNNFVLAVSVEVCRCRSQSSNAEVSVNTILPGIIIPNSAAGGSGTSNNGITDRTKNISVRTVLSY